MERNIETFLGCDREYNPARVVVFGAPYDSTTSFRPGARFGPRAARSESFGLETFSPYQDRDLTEIPVFDGGDLELSFGPPEPALAAVGEMTARVLADNKLPLMIGGEHLLSLGAIQAAWKKYPDLRIIHFDAHADLRDEYLGQELSHATVMRRAWKLVGDGRIYQFGIRSGDGSEFAWGAGHVVTRRFDLSGLGELIESLGQAPVYFSLDLDILDPSCFPGTGTPEPGGLTFKELLAAVIEVGRLNLVGADLMELCPVYDSSGRSTAVLCKILRELIIAAAADPK